MSRAVWTGTPAFSASTERKVPPCLRLFLVIARVLVADAMVAEHSGQATADRADSGTDRRRTRDRTRSDGTRCCQRTDAGNRKRCNAEQATDDRAANRALDAAAGIAVAVAVARHHFAPLAVARR